MSACASCSCCSYYRELMQASKAESRLAPEGQQLEHAYPMRNAPPVSALPSLHWQFVELLVEIARRVPVFPGDQASYYSDPNAEPKDQRAQRVFGSGTYLMSQLDEALSAHAARLLELDSRVRHLERAHGYDTVLQEALTAPENPNAGP